MIGPDRYRYTLKEINSVVSLPMMQTALLRPPKIESRKYGVPGLCGYSTDRATVYIDRDMPIWKYIDSDVLCSPFLVLHARMEMTVRDGIATGDQTLLLRLRMTDAADDPLGHAHSFATACEHFAVFSRFNETGLNEYTKFADYELGRIIFKPYPPDLDRLNPMEA